MHANKVVYYTVQRYSKGKKKWIFSNVLVDYIAFYYFIL